MGGKDAIGADGIYIQTYVVSRRNWNRSRLNTNLKSMLDAVAAREGVPPAYEAETRIWRFVIEVEDGYLGATHVRTLATPARVFPPFALRPVMTEV